MNKKIIIITLSLLIVAFIFSYRHWENPIKKSYTINNISENEIVNLKIEGGYYKSFLREDYLLLKFFWNDEVIPSKECLNIPFNYEGSITERTPISDKIRSQVYVFDKIISGKFTGRYYSIPYSRKRYEEFGIVALTKDYKEIYIYTADGIYVSGDSKEDVLRNISEYFNDFYDVHINMNDE